MRGAARRGLIALALLGGTGSAAAAPIVADTALPVAEEEIIARSQGILALAEDGSADRRTLVWANLVGYGITSDWAVFAAVPLVFDRFEPTGGEAQKIEDVGDTVVFARWIAVAVNRPGQLFRIAPFAGVELPTGGSGAGSGAVDGILGITSTYLVNAFELDLSARYQRNAEDGGTGIDPGDTLNVDASLQVRVWPRVLGPGAPGFVYAVTELNYIHADEARIEGASLAGSGRSTLFLTPGIQYVTQAYTLEAAVQIPVARGGDDFRPRDDLVFRIGASHNF